MRAALELGPNPFPGLRPFEERDARWFFGREQQVDELLERLGRSRFVAVVGTSASGKSSLVRAGLLPALRVGFMTGAGSRWRIVTMRPGNDPLGNLAAELDTSGALGKEAGAAPLRVGLARAVLERGEFGLVEVVQQADLRTDENVLLVVDQFEELFRFKQDRNNAAAFVKLLLAASSYEKASLYILLTMRSDFLGDCSQFRDLPETINDGLFLVPRPTRDQLGDAIESPIGVAGAEISPVLVNKLLNELGDSQDQLPVLQHALMRTWETWAKHKSPDSIIDTEDFERTGGLERALSKHGDNIYQKLPADLRLVTEKVFKALTDKGSDNRGVRRPTTLSDLEAIAGAGSDQVREIVNEFRAAGRSFLTPPPEKDLQPDTTIDISHESLMRIWDLLRKWVDEEAASAQEYRRVLDAAQRYEKREAALLTDPDLTIAVNWRERNRPTVAWAAHIFSSESETKAAADFQTVQRFLDKSVEEHRKRIEAEHLQREEATRLEIEKAQQAAELATARERAAEQAAQFANEREQAARRLARRTGIQAIAMAAVAIVAIIFGIVSVREKQAAVRAQAQAHDLAAERQADVGLQQSSGRVGAVLVIEAYGQASTPTTKSALLTQLLNLDEFAHVNMPSWSLGAFADHGNLFAAVAGSSDESSGAGKVAENSALTVTYLKPSEQTITQNLSFAATSLCGFRSAPEVAVADSASVRLYTYAFGSGANAEISSRTWRASAPIVALACMPQASTVAVAESDGKVSVVDVARGRSTVVTNLGDRKLSGIIPSNSGRFLAILGPALQYFSIYPTGGGAGDPVVHRLQYPACHNCSGELAFDASDSRVAWIDGQHVEVSSLGGTDSPKIFNCSECVRDSLLIWTPDKIFPDVLMSGRHIQFDDVTKQYQGHFEYKPSSDFAPLPVYDPDSQRGDPHFASVETDGIAFRSLADNNVPMVGSQTDCPGGGTFGVGDTSLVLTGKSPATLPFAGNGKAAISCSASDPVLGDPGDGKNLVSLNLKNATVDVFTIVSQASGSSLQAVRTFDLPAEQRGEPRERYSLAYDAAGKIVTVASGWGVSRFSSDGKLIGQITRAKLEQLAGRGHSTCPLRLSPRGTYVRVPAATAKCPPNPENRGPRVSAETLVTAAGDRVKGASFADLWTISNDERFAFGIGRLPGYVAYQLPSLDAVPMDSALVHGGVINVSSDARTVAYQTADREIQLFDLDLQQPIASALPTPPKLDKFLQLDFSPDGAYLVAAYRATDGSSRVAAYNLDPSYWRTQLCDEVKGLTQAEKRDIGEIALEGRGEQSEDQEIAVGDAMYKNVCR